VRPGAVWNRGCRSRVEVEASDWAGSEEDGGSDGGSW
jgi:hypothetical protein